MKMDVVRIEEAGYRSALLGLSLYRRQPLENMPALASKLADKDGGHNKFLEHMYVWLNICAPRYWWVEADTYRVSSKQSEGTMYNFKHFEFKSLQFEEGMRQDTLDLLNLLRERKQWLDIKRYLPESYLQTRTWCLSYKTLRNIILQRWNHELPHWREFCEQVLASVDHPELLPRS